MSLYRLGDQTFLNYKSSWFVWESAWDSWRPIDALSWNGTQFRIDDRAYTANLFSDLYGYGTPQMKTVCEALTTTYGGARGTAAVVNSLSIGPTEWWRDRFVCVSPCVPRTTENWKKMCRGKPRTCRHIPKGKTLTRRQRI